MKNFNIKNTDKIYIGNWLQEDQYARWMAAIKLASRGKSLADASYQSEVRGIQAFLSLQQPARTPAISPDKIDIQVEDFLAPRFVKRIRGGKVSREKDGLGSSLGAISLYVGSASS